MTNKFWIRSSLLILLGLFVYTTTFSQRSKRSDRSRQEQPKLVDKLWYGGGFALGFFGGGLPGFQSSEFFVGISPMVGYKITDIVSVGPRMEVSLLTGRYDNGISVEKNTAVNYGGGVFGRLRFFDILFAHAEYGYINQAIPVFRNGGIETDRLGSDQFLLGLGYNSGYPWGSEIYILYDLLAPEDTVELPISFRFGFTYLF
ncbi:MAG: hypothetical protein R3275_00115 [Saprospiraceae bacterium]|nr:hypothetical protein [Saprospiraceae bacterium]